MKHYINALSDWDGQLNFTYDHMPLAALMAILDEMKKLNRVMQCHNVQKGFRALTRLARNDEAAFKRRVANAVRKRLKRKGA